MLEMKGNGELGRSGEMDISRRSGSDVIHCQLRAEKVKTENWEGSAEC